MTFAPYDRERAKRYKKWWAVQRGAPRGELVEVEPEAWWRRVESEQIRHVEESAAARKGKEPGLVRPTVARNPSDRGRAGADS